MNWRCASEVSPGVRAPRRSRKSHWVAAVPWLAALLLVLAPGLAKPVQAQQQGLYWQCVAPSTSNPNGGYCPAGFGYPLPQQNQARDFGVLTKSDTTVLSPPTKGIHIGDAAACNITVVGSNGTTAVELANQQPGSDHPYSIKQLMAATTCTNVVALY